MLIEMIQYLLIVFLVQASPQLAINEHLIHTQQVASSVPHVMLLSFKMIPSEALSASVCVLVAKILGCSSMAIVGATIAAVICGKGMSVSGCIACCQQMRCKAK